MLQGLLGTDIPRNKPPITQYTTYKYTGTDPYLANVVLHLLGNGANNSTTITDSSPLAKTVTRVGSPTISTTQSKYGRSSLNFLTNGSYLSFANTDFLFTNINFTVEAWIYFPSPSTNPFGQERSICGIWSATDPNAQSWLLIVSNGALQVVGEIISGDNLFFNVPNVITQERWYHVAFVRNNSLMYLFCDGVLLSTYNCGTASFSNTTNTFGVGGYNRDSGTGTCGGYIDSLRITRGVARYTTNFNPETDTYLSSTFVPEIILKSKVPTFLSKTYVY